MGDELSVRREGIDAAIGDEVFTTPKRRAMLFASCA